MSRAVQSVVSVRLPLPPSVNQAFAARHGSHLLIRTAAYRSWAREVGEWYGEGEHLPVMQDGRCGLWLDLPDRMRGDIDNRTKLAMDVLTPPKPEQKKRGLSVMTDDKHVRGLHVAFTDLPKHQCDVTLVTMTEWPAYVALRME